MTEYACPVFHNGLPQYLSDELESLQKRALRIIYPMKPYSEALTASNPVTLSERRKQITKRLFDEITTDESHKLHDLLPPRNTCAKQLRNIRKFILPTCKTNRLKNSFIYSKL